MIINSYRFVDEAVDSDAQAFIDAMTSPTSTEEDAVKVLVDRLKGTGTTNGSDLWTKVGSGEIFPCAFSSAANNTLGLTRAFDGTQVNSPTNSNGMVVSGSEYMRTGIAPSVMNNNDVTIGVWLLAGSKVTEIAIGSNSNGSGTQRLFMIPWHGTLNQLLFDCYDAANGRTVSTMTAASGLLVGTRRSASDAEIYRNGSSLATNTSTEGGSQPTHELYIGAYNNIGTASLHLTDTVRFAVVMDGLTDNEVTDLNDSVTDFLTELGL